MNPLIILSLTIGTAVAKAIAISWITKTDATYLEELTTDLLELLRDKIGSETQRKHATEQVEAIGQKIIDQLRPMFEQYKKQRRDLNYEAVALEIADTLRQSNITPDVIIACRLEPKKLVQYIINNRVGTTDTSGILPPNEIAKVFSDDEVILYQRMLLAISKAIIYVAEEMAGFGSIVWAANLQGQDLILNRVSELLDRPGKEMAEFEKTYNRLIGQLLDKLGVFGIPYADELSERQKLSLAYVALHVERHFRKDRPTELVGIVPNASQASVESISVEELLSQNRRLVIRGDAGSGKSTLLKWIAVRAAQKNFPPELIGWKNVVPFLIRLRKRVDRVFPRPEEFPLLETEAVAGDMPSGWVHYLLKNGRAVVLVDGVDELPGQQREEMLESLKQLVAAYPLARYIVTSRPTAVNEREWPAWKDWTEKEDFVTATFQRMNIAQINTFIDQWHAALSHAIGSTKGEFTVSAGNLKQIIRTRNSLRDLASSPLLCAMICALHHHRGESLSTEYERIRLYYDCVIMLLGGREEKKKVKLVNDYPQLGYDEKLRLIRHLAYWMMHENYSIVETSKADQAFQRYLAKTVQQKDVTGSEIRRYFVERTNLLREPVINYIEFTHRTFQEFLAAQAIYAEDHSRSLIKDHVRDNEWRETFILYSGYVGTIRDPERTTFLKQLINRGKGFQAERSRHQVFSLAIACLEGKVGLEKEAQDYVLRETAEIFPPKDDYEANLVSKAGDPAIPLLQANPKHTEIEAAMCVRALAFIGSPAALQAIKGYISDKRPRVLLEIGRAWDNFDHQDYIQQILNHCQTLHLHDYPDLIDLDQLAQLRVLKISSSGQTTGLSLLSNLTNLIELDISETQVSDLSPLSTLSQLTTLKIGKEWRPMNDNPLSDEYQWLKYGFRKGPVLDLSPLSNLFKLVTLNIGMKRVSDFNPLASLTNLTTLDLSYVEIVSFHEDELFAKATSVVIEQGRASVSLLQRRLRIGYSRAARLIDEMEEQGIIGSDGSLGRTTLMWENYKGIEFTEKWDFLSNLSKLALLNISGTSINHLGPISQLSNLTQLDVSNTEVSDLNPISKLSSLRVLDISNTLVSDLSPLANLHELAELYIKGIKVSDLSPLAQLEKFTKLDITGNPTRLLVSLKELRGRLQVIRNELSFTL